jgi:glucokinase
MASAHRPRPGSLDLLADIGGTNARFALVRGAVIERQSRVLVADYPDPAAAVRAFLGPGIGPRSVRRAALAVAGPVTDGEARLTNGPWRISARSLGAVLDTKQVHVVNDFEAVAWALPALKGSDLRPVGGGTAEPGRPAAVIGPGTGLGVAGFVPGPGGPRILVTEGGHVTMAAADEEEERVLGYLRGRFAHVSAERVLSGAGLVNLYQAICALAGVAAAPLRAEDITRAARTGDAPECRAAVTMFCAMLGTVAGNLALTLGARGGIYIAGGVVPQLGEAFAASPFRARFEDKGRFRTYLAAIPTSVIVHPTPAFPGLLALLEAKAAES